MRCGRSSTRARPPKPPCRQVDLRIAARKSSNSTLLRREQLVSEHLQAPSLSKLFPGIGQLRVELVFNDPNTRFPQPSSQLRTLYSAAPAFFRFACPCADCDGHFDLTGAVTALVAKDMGRSRTASLDGRVSCQGMRFREHALLQSPCSMELTFRLRAEPLPAG